MADDDRPTGDDGVQSEALTSLGEKLDTVAGALAAIAGSHSELLGHVAEAEARRSHDAREMAQRLGALERQILALPTPPVPPPVDPLDPFPAVSASADLEQLRSDLTLGLDVLAQVAEGVRRLDVRIERVDAQMAELGAAVAALQDEGPTPVRERLVEMAGRLTLHTDIALAGALRVIDDRLAALRTALTDAVEAGQARPGGIEAGTAQLSWNRLERHLDAEFDEVGRQLEAIGALVEHTAASADRPFVTTDQLRKAASAVKDSVTSAGRSRRDRRGGPGLGTDTDTSNETGNGLET